MPPRSRKKETSDELHASHNNTQQESQQEQQEEEEEERRQPKDSKKKSKGKQSSLLSEGGGEPLTHAHDVTSDKSEVITDLGPFLLEQQSEPVQNRDANELTPSRKKRKRKGKNMSTSEGTETSHDFSHNESLLLHESEIVEVEEEESSKLFTEEADSATPRKKVMNLPTSEANVVKSEQCEVMPNLDTLISKDLDCVLVSQAESFAEENGTDRICSEPELVTPRKKRKGKRKSLSKSEGVDINLVESEHDEICSNLAALPPKEVDPLLFPEAVPFGDNKNGANQLSTTTRLDSTSRKFEGAEMKDMGSENLDLCPKLDSLAHNDSDPLLLPASESAPIEVGRKKKRRRNKNKGELESEGVKSKRPSDEHSQQCYNAKPTVPEEQNQRKRKRPVMNENQDSLVKPKVTSYMLNSKVVGRASQISRRPLKRYEHYEVCDI